MPFWRTLRRAVGGSDPRYWHVPGFLEMRLRSDARQRAAFGVALGLAVGGPCLALVLVLAPSDEGVKAWTLGGAPTVLVARHRF